MFRTQILANEPAMNPPLIIPPELGAQVERANRILEFDLLRSLSSFEIDVDWRFVRREGNKISVLLDLTTRFDGNRVGITGWPLDADVFRDDTHTRAGLDRPTRNFIDVLSYVNKTDTKRGRERFQDALFAEGK